MTLTQPYPLETEFQRACAVLAATTPSFYGVVGHAVDPSGLTDPTAKLAFEAAHAHFRDLGRGPKGALYVLQRIRRWHDDGRVTWEQLVAASDMFDAAEDDPQNSYDEAEAAVELVPVLRRSIEQQVALAAADDYGKQRDFGATQRLIEAARSLGEVRVDRGEEVALAQDAILRLVGGDRLPTGVDDLDPHLRGGLRRGCFGMWLGATGEGKSVALGHVAAVAVRLGLRVAYATLELAVGDVFSRAIANLTGWAIDDVVADPTVAIARMEADLPTRGTLVVNEFAPLATTFPDVAAWVADLERQEGYSVDVLLTDYGDKLGAPKTTRKSSDEHGYRTGLVVFEAMRQWARTGGPSGLGRWHWSASQATRRRDRKRLLEVDDTADSMHKSRVADLVVSINLDQDQQATFKVAKGRFGGAGVIVGPCPTDYACGRLVCL